MPLLVVYFKTNVKTNLFILNLHFCQGNAGSLLEKKVTSVFAMQVRMQQCSVVGCTLGSWPLVRNRPRSFIGSLRGLLGRPVTGTSVV